MSLSKRRSKRFLGVGATLLILLVPALAGCGGSSGGAADDGTPATDVVSTDLPSLTGPIGASDDGGTPVDGGVLRAILSATDSPLDPIKNLQSGQTGLNELTAIYDALMRYDPSTDSYVPQLAESLTPNADFTEYTLKLRPNVKFTDGTPLDSAAVKFGFDRFSGPDSALVFYAVYPEIVSMETPDPLTVVMKLKASDTQFPFLLTNGFGQVVSPTAVTTMGEEAFALAPVGAGPFMVDSYEPNSKLSLVRNPNYWGAAPHLDGIDFTWVADDGAKADALESGDVDVVSILDPVQAKQAVDQGATGFGWLTYGAPVVSMNMREGFPFADLRLRQAVSYAVDAEALNTRVYEGLGYPSKSLFPAGLLESDAPEPETSQEKASALVQEVKDSTGWDGSFTLLSAPEPSAKNAALSVQAMLNNVGFNATVDTPPNWSDSVYLNFDYDAVVTSLGFLETDPWLFLVYEAGGAFSPTGFEDPRMDAALVELQAASTPEARRSATTKIEEIWQDVVPSVWMGHRVDRMLNTSNVHGLVYSASSVALFNEAWLSN